MHCYLVIISNKFSPQIFIDSVFAYIEDAEEQIIYLEQEMGGDYKFYIEEQKIQGLEEM